MGTSRWNRRISSLIGESVDWSGAFAVVFATSSATVSGLVQHKKLADIGTITGIATVIGGVLGLVVGVVWHALSSSAATDDQFPIRGELISELREEYWQMLLTRLPTTNRIALPFSASRHVFPQGESPADLRTTDDLHLAFAQSSNSSGGRRLVLVGPPGSGKTIALYELAVTALEEAAGDGDLPVPLILNLASWTGESLSPENRNKPVTKDDDFESSDLLLWAAQSLALGASILAKFGTEEIVKLISDGRITLWLDGLDEIDNDELRKQCLLVLNKLCTRLDPTVSVVLCCRSEQLNELAGKARHRRDLPRFKLGIEFAPARSDQILQAIREQRDPRLSKLHEHALYRPNSEISRLLRSPLWLSMAIESRFDPTGMADGDVRAKLLDSFLASRIDHQERIWLSSIADFLNDQRTSHRTIFRLVDLTYRPAPLAGPLRRSEYLVRAMGAAIIGVPFVLLHTHAFALIAAIAGFVFGPTMLYTPTDYAEPVGRIRFGRIRRTPIPRPDASGILTTILVSLYFVWTCVKWTAFTFPLFVGASLIGDKGVVAGVRAWVVVILACCLVTLLQRYGEYVCATILDESPAIMRDPLSTSRWSLVAHLMVFMVVVGGAGHILFGIDGAMFGYPLGAVLGLGVGYDTGGGRFVWRQTRVRRAAQKAQLLPSSRKLSPWLGRMVNEGLMQRSQGGFEFRHSELRDHLATSTRSRLADLYSHPVVGGRAP